MSLKLWLSSTFFYHSCIQIKIQKKFKLQEARDEIRVYEKTTAEDLVTTLETGEVVPANKNEVAIYTSKLRLITSS